LVEEVTGSYDGKGLSIGIVLSEFNDFVTEKLREGALRALDKCGVDSDAITIYRVPGSFEIPDMARNVLRERDHDGVLCLGAVIRGDTPHFDYICSEVTKGIGQLNLEHDVPLTYGVLTTDTVEQAVERAGTKAGNKGHETALALIQTINAYESL
jgi:6,7-dimethyl-8-ribityllumazine synthase